MIDAPPGFRHNSHMQVANGQVKSSPILLAVTLPSSNIEILGLRIQEYERRKQLPINGIEKVNGPRFN
jgi:hypothetical protein